MADLTNAQIAAAFDELGDLYELDGAVVLPRDRLPHGGQDRARVVRVGGAADARRPRHRAATGSARRSRRRSTRSTRPATSRPPKKLRDKFPSGLISVMHLPGFGPKRARRLYDELGDRLARGAARGRRGAEDPRAARVRRRRSRRSCSRRSPSARGRRRRRGSCCRARRTIAEQIVGALRAHPAAEQVEVAGSLRRPGRLGQGPRHHRHRQGPGGAGGGARRAVAGRVGAHAARRRRRARR